MVALKVRASVRPFSTERQVAIRSSKVVAEFQDTDATGSDLIKGSIGPTYTRPVLPDSVDCESVRRGIERFDSKRKSCEN